MTESIRVVMFRKGLRSWQSSFFTLEQDDDRTYNLYNMDKLIKKGIPTFFDGVKLISANILTKQVGQIKSFKVLDIFILSKDNTASSKKYTVRLQYEPMNTNVHMKGGE